ncbi:MAG: DUF340 domain-containing protein [Flavobacteriia bacterium]|nr:MAG: DUF340 domain-containing protein [Flavobacteriia bacterium]
MIEVLVTMSAGMVIGYLIHHKKTLLKINEKLTMYAVYVLLFLLGINIGLNEQIINNIHTLGLDAALITIGALLGSLICAYYTYKLFFTEKPSDKNPSS